MASLRLFLARLAVEQRGTGIMELGIALPVLLILLLGTVDASRMAATKIDLEQAAQRTTDYALAKRPRNSSDAAYLQTEGAAAAGVPVSNVTVRLYLECDGVQVDFALTCLSTQVRARYVSVGIVDTVDTLFDWGALTSVIGFRVLPSSIQMQGDSIVRIQ